ncbi:MAG: histidine phosphatase family protein, partial [Nocardioidaceae bacterium]
MPLTVVRHAPTAANHTGVFQGQTDVPPLPLQEVAPIPAQPTDVLWSSPLQRAVVAARALFPGHEPRLDPRLMERAVGAWEGLARTAVAASWPDSFVDGRVNPDVTPPGGES